jgi:hypothetical protein
MLTILFYPYVDYFVYAAGKKSLPRYAKSHFADVVVTFSMSHQQKSQHRG